MESAYATRCSYEPPVSESSDSGDGPVNDLLSAPREPKELRPRAGVAGLVALALFLVLGSRLYYLQLAQGDELSRKSRENFKKVLVEPAERGRIVDHRGRVLASNRPSFDVYLTPAFSKQVDEVLARLALHLDLSVDEVEHVRNVLTKARGLDRFKAYLVKLDITWQQLMVVKADLPNLEGVDIIDSPHREYCPVRAPVAASNHEGGPSSEQRRREPAFFADDEAESATSCDGALIAHVVGYLSEVTPAELEQSEGKYRRGDFIGRKGLERTLERYLRGVDGRILKAVDSKGRELEESLQRAFIPEDQRRVPSKPGHNVVLSLDLGLQSVAQRAMEANGKAGAVVVVDVHTGFVLAMVSYPAYDPNRMTGRISRRDLKAIADDPLEPLFQRAVQQHYHPGSVFKIVTALAGLKSGKYTPANSVSCPGSYKLGSRRWRCWKDAGHGSGINLKQSLKVSCDTYYYAVAHQLGLRPIADMAHELGFGKRTGIELSPETPGLIPTEEWHRKVEGFYSDGFALNASIGQGSVNVTPIQVAMAYAAVANGGILYRPRLVRRIENAAGEVVENFPPEVVHDLEMPAAHLAAVMDGLTAVMEEPGGTGYWRRLADVHAGGKSGTAQVVRIGDKRVKNEDLEWLHRDHAWFAGVAPAEDPEIAVVAINEHGGSGGSAAGPIVMATIQGYFDIKKREAAGHGPLTPKEIVQLDIEPHYAWQARRPRSSTPAVPAQSTTVQPASTAARASDDDEPASTAAEVADPSLLRDTQE